MKKNYLKKLIWPLQIALLPLVLYWLCQTISLQSPLQSIAWMATHLPAALLADLLLLGLVALFYGLFCRIWAAALCSGLPLLLMTLISFYKEQINSEPLLLSDFYLAGDLGNIASYAQIRFSFITIFSVVLFLLLLWNLSRLDRKHPMPRRRGFLLFTAALCLLLSATLSGPLQNAALALNKGETSAVRRNQELGVPLALYVSYASVQNSFPGQYDADAMEQALIRLRQSVKPEQSTSRQPTIIFLMSESFFDITRFENVTYSADPLPNFHALQQSYASGQMISNTFGGGTGYVEMEVLTGIFPQTLQEDQNLAGLDTVTYSHIPSLVRMLKAQGYDTAFLHAHTNQLYQRAEHFSALGFDRTLFSDSFPSDVQHKGGYISDHALTQQIISLYEQRDPSRPLFLYALSMENHQPYTAGKFSVEEKSSITLDSDLLSQEGKDSLHALLTGIQDADAALMELVEYFQQQEEPVVLLFWGDHLPSLYLSDGSTIYSSLGYASSPDTKAWSADMTLKMLSTDYLIWANFQGEFPRGLCSSSALGSQTLTAAGLRPSWYFAWLEQQVLPSIQMYRSNLFVDGSGQAYSSLPESSLALWQQYHLLLYDSLYGANYLGGKLDELLH